MTIKAVVDLMDKYNMGYGSINHTRSRCLDCGFENAEANLVKCPKCGTVFQISETDYDSIVKQIRDKEFEKELSMREQYHKQDKESAIKLAKADIEKCLTEECNEEAICSIYFYYTVKNKTKQVSYYYFIFTAKFYS